MLFLIGIVMMGVTWNEEGEKSRMVFKIGKWIVIVNVVIFALILAMVVSQ
jgi:Na+/H+ antiporter NhaC